MSYQALEAKIENMPEQYIQEVSQFIDFLMFKNKHNVNKKTRPLGFLKNKASVDFSNDFNMTDEELVNL